MAFSATVANKIPEQELANVLKLYDPLLNLSFVIVVVNLGMPLDYRLIAGAGLFTAIYIRNRGTITIYNNSNARLYGYIP